MKNRPIPSATPSHNAGIEQTDSLKGQNVFFGGYAKIGLKHLVLQKTIRAFDQGNVYRLV